MFDRTLFNYREEKDYSNEVMPPPQCKNCEYIEGSECGFFSSLNEALPETFDLETVVAKNGNCSAFTKQKSSLKNLEKKANSFEEEKEVDKD